MAHDLHSRAIVVCSVTKSGEVNVLISQANWAWPEAVRNIFQPRGVGLLIAEDANDALDIINKRRIYTAIVDVESEKLNAFATIKIIHVHHPLLPCILLARAAEPELLSKALRLDVFSVIAKPVDMTVLLAQLNKLFLRRYSSAIFSD